MSRTHQRWAFILILVFAVVIAACQPSPTPTPTPRPTATAVPPTETTAPTEEVTTEATAESVAAATEIITEVAPTEEMTTEATSEMTEAATEEMTTGATTEATAEMTTEATMEATMETTAEATAALGTIIDVAKADGNFNTLLTALDKAGLTDTLSGTGPYTVFAPTDAAFQALLDSMNMTSADLLDRSDLADILMYHVAPGKITSDDLQNYKSTDNPDQIIVPTLDGDQTLTITFADDGTIVINGTAKVTLTNVEASNGVIYVIDTVLMPPSAEATVEATVSAEATEMATEVAMVPTMAMTTEATMEMTEAAMSTAEPTMAPGTEEATGAAGMASGSTVMVSPDQEVIVGLAAGLSGEGIAPLGIDIQRGAELALADRPTVMVDGKTFNVKLDVQDSQCSADGGQAVANRFASESGMIGVVGPMCSSACRAAAPIFDAADYTNISPSCTAPDLTTSSYTSFNRDVVSDSFQGRIAADFIYNVLGLRKIATIHDGSPYGEGLVAVVTQRFEELGGQVVSSDAVQVGGTDFRGLLDDIAQKDPELIYFGGFPAEAARLIQQRADVGLDQVPFMGADGINGTEVISLAGKSSEGIYATKAIPASSQALDDFLTRYKATYGEEPPAPYHANAYDAVNILLDAVEAVGTVDANGDLNVSRDAVMNYVRNLKDFQGLTGVLNGNGSGETSLADIGVFQVQSGDFVQLYTGNVVNGETQLTAYVAPTEEPVMAATEAATAEMTEMATEAPTMEATAEATTSS